MELTLNGKATIENANSNGFKYLVLHTEENKNICVGNPSFFDDNFNKTYQKGNKVEVFEHEGAFYLEKDYPYIVNEEEPIEYGE